ncbi:hypothetical protein ScPMuIL_008887 [Solemya velum]
MAGNNKTREDEATEYLQKHRIIELFNNLTSQIIYQRPEEPKKFMIEQLERLKKAQRTNIDYPCLFDDSNIQSVFGMLDPTNTGFITLEQYEAAFTTLGITKYNKTQDMIDRNQVSLEEFLKEAKHGIIHSASTYSK